MKLHHLSVCWGKGHIFMDVGEPTVRGSVSGNIFQVRLNTPPPALHSSLLGPSILFVLVWTVPNWGGVCGCHTCGLKKKKRKKRAWGVKAWGKCALPVHKGLEQQCKKEPNCGGDSSIWIKPQSQSGPHKTHMRCEPTWFFEPLPAFGWVRWKGRMNANQEFCG